MKFFLLKLLLFATAIAAVNLCWIRFMPLEKHIPHVWLMIGFFVAMTALFHTLSQNASKDRPQVLIRFFMIKTVLRLFICLGVILAYRFHDKNTLIPFAVGFMVHYFLFSAFEVLVIRKELKRS